MKLWLEFNGLSIGDSSNEKNMNKVAEILNVKIGTRNELEEQKEKKYVIFHFLSFAGNQKYIARVFL